VRFEQKWANRPENQYRAGTNKRVKHNESGAYTSSSNHESEDPEPSERTRPEGQKKAKERLKGKEKKYVDEFSLEKLRTKKCECIMKQHIRKQKQCPRPQELKKILQRLNCWASTWT
jgi:hypothetical protein